MIRLGLVLIAGLATDPVMAGQGLICDGPDVTVHVPLAGIAGISPLRADIAFEGRHWSTDDALGGVQAYGSADAIRIDFLDSKAEEAAIRLRVFSASEADDEVAGGVLQIVGQGAWPLTCSFG